MTWLVYCSTRCLIKDLKRRKHAGSGACPVSAERLQLAGGNMGRGRHEFGFHFCQICPASVGVFLAAN